MRVGIGAKKSGYWCHLVDYIQKKGLWQMELFTEKERLLESVEDSSMDVLFLQKDFCDRDSFSIPVIYFGEGTDCILPYREAEQVFLDMKAVLASQSGEEIGDKGRERLVAVHSPSGRSGATDFALAYCKEHSFFYLGMEEYGTVGKDRSSMEELLYHIRNRKKDIGETLEALSEEWQGIRMIPSPEFFSDIHRVQSEDFLWFFEQVRGVQGGMSLLFDFGTGMLDHLEILDAFDKVYVPVVAGEREEEKLKVFQNMLLEVNGDKKEKLIFIQVPKKPWNQEGFLDEVKYLEGEGF